MTQQYNLKNQFGLCIATKAWVMNGVGIAAILTPPKGPKLCYVAKLEFLTTNNIAQYEAVLLGL